MTTHNKALCLYGAAVLALVVGAYLRSFVFMTVGSGAVVLFVSFLASAALIAKGRQVSRSI